MKLPEFFKGPAVLLMDRKSFLKGLAGLPLVKPLTAAVSGEAVEVDPAPQACERCGGAGFVRYDGPLPQDLLDNRRYDYLPDETGWKITQVPCPRCRAEEWAELFEVVPTSADPEDAAAAEYATEYLRVVMQVEYQPGETFAEYVERERRRLVKEFREKTYRHLYGPR